MLRRLHHELLHTTGKPAVHTNAQTAAAHMLLHDGPHDVAGFVLHWGRFCSLFVVVTGSWAMCHKSRPTATFIYCIHAVTVDQRPHTRAIGYTQ